MWIESVDDLLRELGSDRRTTELAIPDLERDADHASCVQHDVEHEGEGNRITEISLEGEIPNGQEDESEADQGIDHVLNPGLDRDQLPSDWIDEREVRLERRHHHTDEGQKEDVDDRCGHELSQQVQCS